MATDFSALDPSLVAANLAEAEARLAELHPTLDLKRGPVRDLVAYPHAVLAAALQAEVAGYLSARSLAAAAANPAAADPATVDAACANFRVYRRPAGTAAGTAVVVVTTDATVVLAAGAAFSSGGRRYLTPRVYVAKAESAQVRGPGDRLITALPGGGYAFEVDLAAETPGSAGVPAKGAALVPSSPPPGFVRAFAKADFTGGADAETNAELLARLDEGVAARGPSSRLGAAAMLRDRFPGLVGLSVVGRGDPEMVRDKHGLLPLAGGGRTDWYVRTSRRAPLVTLRVTAAFVEAGADGYGVWQFALGRGAAPGYYEVRSVLPAGATPADHGGSLPVLSDTRAYDLSGVALPPDVADAAEAAYSRFQTSVVRFSDTTGAPTGRSPGDTADYDVTVVALPDLAAVQDFAGSRDHVAVDADVLVRAAVPCFVTASLTVNLRPGDPGPDAALAAAAVAEAVNRAGFSGKLFVSDLAAAAAPHTGGRLSRVGVVGRFRYPDGRQRYAAAEDELVCPDDPGAGVSARTVQFFCDPDGVAVNTAVSLPPA